MVWTKHRVTRKPLLCIAGHKPKQIQFIDIETGEHLIDQTLVGHGKGINDLAISPLSTSILASVAEDYTVRLWNLEPAYAKQPCVAIFAGEGHRQPILACHFHPNGRWILSSGLDTAICLWAVPSLKALERDHDVEGNPPDPKVIYYPHFHSTEVHANYVDCMAFYGDLIISRASKDQTDENKRDNTILLWKIDGFDSDDEPSPDPPIPRPGVYTRSSFPHSERSCGFQRLLTFDMPYTGRFYLRFGFLHAAGMRPILAMGNEQSKFHFWDLQKLEEGYDASEEKKAKKLRGRKPGPKPKGVATTAVNKSNLDRLGELRREQSGASEGAAGGTRMYSLSLSLSSPPVYQPHLPTLPYPYTTLHHTSHPTFHTAPPLTGFRRIQPTPPPPPSPHPPNANTTSATTSPRSNPTTTSSPIRPCRPGSISARRRWRGVRMGRGWLGSGIMA